MISSESLKYCIHRVPFFVYLPGQLIAHFHVQRAIRFPRLASFPLCRHLIDANSQVGYTQRATIRVVILRRQSYFQVGVNIDVTASIASLHHPSRDRSYWKYHRRCRQNPATTLG